MCADAYFAARYDDIFTSIAYGDAAAFMHHSKVSRAKIPTPKGFLRRLRIPEILPHHHHLPLIHLSLASEDGTHLFHHDVATRHDLADGLAVCGDVCELVFVVLVDDADFLSGCEGVPLAGHELCSFLESGILEEWLAVTPGEGAVCFPIGCQSI